MSLSPVFEPPLADSIWDQSRIIANDQTLRNFVLNEPRGNLAKHVNLLVPPKNQTADFGFIIMEPEDTPPNVRVKYDLRCNRYTGDRFGPKRLNPKPSSYLKLLAA